MNRKAKINWLARAVRLRPKTPAGKSGDVAVVCRKVRAGETHCVVSARNAFMTGEQPLNVAFDEPVVVRSLEQKSHGCWMRDDPQEIWQMHESLVTVHGRVLVGGLGLGVWSRLAANLSAAKSLLVVEINPHVIDLVWPSTVRSEPSERLKYELRNGDVAQVLGETNKGEYDCAFLDTWQGTGEYCWQSEVVPLRRLARRVIPSVRCWAESEMITQVRESSLRALLVDCPHHGVPQRVLVSVANAAGLRPDKLFSPVALQEHFLEWMSACEALKSSPSKLRSLIDRFFVDVGSPCWEKEFGDAWDAACESRILDGAKKPSILA